MESSFDSQKQDGLDSIEGKLWYVGGGGICNMVIKQALIIAPGFGFI